MRSEVLYDRGYLVHYSEGDSSLQRTPLNYITSVSDTYHSINEEESLLDIAQKYYGNQALWYVLADVNIDLIEDIFQLTVGTIIVIPSLDILDSIYG